VEHQQGGSLTALEHLQRHAIHCTSFLPTRGRCQHLCSPLRSIQ
jgi:hypothetical protein